MDGSLTGLEGPSAKIRQVVQVSSSGKDPIHRALTHPCALDFELPSTASTSATTIVPSWLVYPWSFTPTQSLGMNW